MVAVPARPREMTGGEIYALRVAGAVVGAIIAPALVPPGTWFPLRRTLVALLSGVFLGGLAQWHFGWPNEPDLIAGSACVVSTLSWWGWHAVLRLTQAGGWLRGDKE